MGHQHHLRVNHTHLDGVFLAVFLLFAEQIENNFLHKKVFKVFLTTNFATVTIN